MLLGPTAMAQTAHKGDKPCMADAARLCPGVEPGGGAQARCLKEHMSELSPACKKKMSAAVEKKEQKELQKQQERAPQPPPVDQPPGPTPR
jgi:hypothetical protein